MPGATTAAWACLGSAFAVSTLGFLGDVAARIDVLIVPAVAVLLACAAGHRLALRRRWNWLFEVSLLVSGLTAVFGQYISIVEFGVGVNTQLFNLLPVTIAAYYRSLSSVAASLLVAGAGRLLVLLSQALTTDEMTIAWIDALILFVAFALNTAVIRQLRATQLRNEDRLRLAAELDPLTQVLNRRGWESWVGANVGPAAILMLDIDNFKMINDTRGHEAGDDLLRVVGRVLSDAISPGDVVARLGGEEFVCLLPHRSVRAAAALSSACAVELAERAAVTASFGVAVWDGVESIDAALRRADSALYAGKASGRNQTRCELGQGPTLMISHPALASYEPV